MRILRVIAGAASLAYCMACSAQSGSLCGQTFEAPVMPGSSLVVSSLSSELVITGADRDGVHVSCSAKDEADVKRIRLKVSQTASQTRLSIVGSHVAHGGVRVRIELPRVMNLAVRLPAGEVNISEVEGNKKINLHAGQITVSSARAWDYKRVNASVGIGEVNAQAYATNKGGFFSAFRKRDASGQYELSAHVMTGEIDLITNEANKKTTVRKEDSR